MGKGAQRRAHHSHEKTGTLRFAHPTNLHCGAAVNRVGRQRGFVLLPVVLAITLVAVIAFMLNNQGTVNVDVTAGVTDSVRADQVARAGLAHAAWGTQHSGCAGDRTLTTVPFGQAGTDSYAATIASPGGATTTTRYYADQDTWIDENSPDTNHASDNTLRVQNDPGSGENLHGLLRFDLSSLPAGTQINSAVAGFFVKVNDDKRSINLHRVTAPWTETDATWDSIAGHYDPQVEVAIPPKGGTDTWVEVNLTPLVQAWVNGGLPNHGILLQATSSLIESRYISREGAAGEQPYLRVVTGTGSASPVTLTATGTLAGSGTPPADITRTLARTAVPALQPQYTLFLQPGPEGKDARIYQWKDAWNYGASNSLTAEAWPPDSDTRSLLQFDLDGIPRGARIHSASLELHQNSSAASGGPFGVHRITSDWVEGSGNGGTAPGVTWNERDTGIPWTTPGGDMDAEAHAITTISAGMKSWYSWDITGLVDGWVNGRYPNQGLALIPEATKNNNAYFESSDAATEGLRPKLTVTYACECGSPCLAPQGKGSVAMIVAQSSNPLDIDRTKQALLESWGYTVTLVDDGASQNAFDSLKDIHDVVFISETVDPATLGSKLGNPPIGIVNEEGGMLSDLGMGGLSGVAIGPSVNVVDTSHYITALFPGGSLDIYSADMQLQGIFNTPAPGLQSLADYSSKPLLAVLETGADLKGGGTAAGRRVMLPFGRDTNKNWDYINANGLLILQRALQWGTGNTGAAPPPPKNLLFVAASTIPTAPEQLRIDLIESWGYTVTLIDDSDSQANFDAAVAANDVAYVASTVSEATLGTKLKDAPIGVVNELATLVDEFGIAQESIGYKSRIEIDVLNNTHYITQPFPTGLLTILNANQDLHIMTSNKAPGLDALAQVFNTGTLWDDSLGAIDTGGDLYGGGTAAGRRVLLPWGTASFDVTTLNADGLTIMQRAIEWAAVAGVPNTLPIAHWTFDEGSGPTAFDTVGGNDATLNGDTAWRTGTINGALDFDGSGDSVRTDTNFTPPPVGTVTFWMRVSGSPASHGRILGLDDTWEIRHVTTGTADGIPYGLVFDLGVTGVNTEFVTTTTVDMPGKWYHIAAAYDTNTDAYAVYIDGITHKSGTYPSALTVPAANLLSIGTRTGSSDYFDGQLDDVRIYDQFLSAAEIALLASGGGNQEEILLVVADATSLTAQDLARQALMVDWGYRVSTISASDSQASFDAAVTTASAAYVVEQQQSTALGTKLRDATIAVISEEAELRADIGFSANRDWPSTRDTVDIIDNSHYITQPFATGLLSIASAPIEVVTLSGQMAGGLQALGQQDWGGPQNSLSVIDTGGDLYGGGTAAGRRVQLPWGRTGFDINALNTNGLKLMQRAIEWGVAGSGGGGGGGGGGGDTVTLTAVADNRIEAGELLNRGGENNVIVGQDNSSNTEHALVQFDLSSLPAGATITGATLRLNAFRENGGANWNIDVHRVTEAWTEMGSNWHQPNGTLPWSGGDGGSYDPAVEASQPGDATGWFEWDVTALAQAWYTGAHPNHGLILVPDSPSRRNDTLFDSREGANPPELVITYTTP